ncbi:TIR-like protein FxsC [Streptomyces sp. NPDC002668]|uniref:TIR-like protein FxsC n=1 Tax=Streptomyces sp. NPDC002668 TaxID=3154422 RepID=UPI0033193695
MPDQPADADPLDSVVRALHGLDRNLDGLSIVDLLWLAAHRWQQAGDGGAESVDGQTEDLAASEHRPALTKQSRRGGDAGQLPLFQPPTGADTVGHPVRDVSLPRAGALPRGRELARALRPLKRPWLRGLRQQLDIDRTVSDFARSGELIPAFRPAPERWFDLTVVLDRSPTMAVWGATADELLKILAGSGVFRSIRVREIDTSDVSPDLHGPLGQKVSEGGSRTAHPRRLMLVMSDCVSAAWRDGAFWGRLHDWAKAMSAVLVNPLPPKIWRSVGLDLPAVRVLSPGTPGVPNSRLRFSIPLLMEDAFPEKADSAGAGWRPFPVVSLSPRAVGGWARTLMRADPQGCEALLIPPPEIVERSAFREEEPVSSDAESVTKAFLHRASPAATRLAVLCSPNPYVHMPLLELVRQELVPEATPADLAEFVVGGLVTVMAGDSRAGGPVGPVLRFRDGVRDCLRPRLGARDAWQLHDALNRFIAQHTGSLSRFPAAVSDAGGTALVPSDLVPLAEASAHTLRALGFEPGPAMDTSAMDTSAMDTSAMDAAAMDAAAMDAAAPGPAAVTAVETIAAEPTDDADPVSARPETTERSRRRASRQLSHGPYFYLSYAHTPKTHPKDKDPNAWVERFYRDLCAHVLQLSSLPAGVSPGFMDQQMRPGESWSERLSDALATCRVLVPLYSPRYFLSEMCGREWYAFAQRSIFQQARTERTTEAIVPALWVPVPAGQLPYAAQRLQFNHAAFGDDYADEGFYGLIKLRYLRDQYERAVYLLAKRIVSVAETADIGPGLPIDFEQIPSAFGPPSWPPSGPNRPLRVTIAAPTRRTLPTGRTPHYYGDSPEDWNPYHPDSVRPIAQVTADLARSLNYQPTVVSLEERIRTLDSERPPKAPEILIVDPWIVEDEERGGELAAFDAVSGPWVSVVVPKNPDDDQGRVADTELNLRLERTVPALISQGWDVLRADAQGVGTLEAFAHVLPRLAEAANREYLSLAETYPPIARHPAPRLRGPMGGPEDTYASPDVPEKGPGT